MIKGKNPQKSNDIGTYMHFNLHSDFSCPKGYKVDPISRKLVIASEFTRSIAMSWEASAPSNPR